jgi:hypothetical protein
MPKDGEESRSGITICESSSTVKIVRSALQHTGSIRTISYLYPLLVTSVHFVVLEYRSHVFTLPSFSFSFWASEQKVYI